MRGKTDRKTAMIKSGGETLTKKVFEKVELQTCTQINERRFV